jgi:phage-related tail protein
MLQLHKNNVIVNNEFTYPKFMTQNDRDFQKVLQALTTFDKKLSNLEIVVDKLAKATTDYATSQQQLNKDQSSLNKDLSEGIKMLGNSMSDIIKFLQKLGGNN